MEIKKSGEDISESSPHLTWNGIQSGNTPLSYISTIDLSTILTIDPKQIIKNAENIQRQNKKLDKSLKWNQNIFKNEWKNRLIHGDSLLGMNHLLLNGFREKIQMIYMDPPFGIDFKGVIKSTSQKVKGYRDHWKRGLGSYLSYLKNRFRIIRELLKAEGSFFVQIGEANVHYVRCLLDELFGPENFVSQITFRTAISTNKITNIADYLLWYAKDKPKLFRRKLFVQRSPEKIAKTFSYIYQVKKTGKSVPFKPQELVKRADLSKNPRKDRNFSINWNSEKYRPPEGFEWRWDKISMERLISLKRLTAINGKLYGMRFQSDFPMMLLTNIWNDTATSTFAAKKHYSVHTNPKVIRRCIAMTTKPGDLVLDPTVGSGTTAIVAEEMGRRWIAFDTSPTAVLSTVNWLMGTVFDNYDSNERNDDFDYKKINRTSLSDLAHNRELKVDFCYDNPKFQSKKSRLTSPFQIEMISNIDSSTPDLNFEKFLGKIRSVIQKNGIMDSSGKKNKFSKIERLPNLSVREDNLNLGVFELILSPEQDPILLIAFPFSFIPSEADFSLIIDFLNLKKKKPKEIIILSPIWDLILIDLYEKLTLALKCTKKSSSYSIIPAMTHPDLFISELSDDKHFEAIYCLGIFSFESDIESSFIHYDFNVHNWKTLKNDQIAAWAIFNRKNFSMENFQIPLFQKFTDKTIQSSVNLPFCNSLLKKRNKKEIISKGKLVYGISSLGISYFGKI
ncbi:MAG: site-specific DNA-methyltransferase [Promethearchaeota archaeon]